MAESAGFLLLYARRLKKKLLNSGAVSEENAKTVDELNLSKREIRTLKRLVWAGKVKKTKDGRYYLSEK
jgi:hypothetical protein